MKQILFFSLILLLSCTSEKDGNKRLAYPAPFYIGTYTSGDSWGIYQCSLTDDGSLTGGKLMAEVNNPAFLTITEDSKFLIAISEISAQDSIGSVISFRMREDSLEYVSTGTSGGAHPCFVSVNRDGFVLVANYTGGNVGLLRMNKNGKLSGLLDLQQHFGTGPTDRQLAPHAHSAWFDPCDNGIISADLGTDDLWISILDTIHSKLVPADPQTVPMVPGAGPRHLAFHPNGQWIYVVNELNCTVTLLFKKGEGQYVHGSSISTLPEGYNETNTCADIHCSADGRFVYASNRGHNSIAIFKVDPDNGTLSIVGHQTVYGSWPRNFAITPDDRFLIVANRRSDNIVSFKRDKSTGLLEYMSEISAPEPVCIKF